MPVYVIIWGYTVKPQSLNSLLEYYTPNGKWATFFRESKDYKSTDLLTFDLDKHVFLTIDRLVFCHRRITPNFTPLILPS